MIDRKFLKCFKNNVLLPEGITRTLTGVFELKIQEVVLFSSP